MGNKWALQIWYCYTNDAFKFFTNQKLAIRIFKKGYSEKDGQQQLLVVAVGSVRYIAGFCYF